MSMTREDVERVAQLARLELRPEEVKKMQEQLGSVLKFVGRLSKIDTTGVPEDDDERAEAGWRSDEAFPSDDLTRTLIIQNFPAHRGEALCVPAIFEKPKG